MSTMHLKPVPGLKVRRPDRRHLAEAGEVVTMTPYWRRRLAAGDVVEVKGAAPAAPAVAETAADEGRTNRKRGQ